MLAYINNNIYTKKKKLCKIKCLGIRLFAGKFKICFV